MDSGEAFEPRTSVSRTWALGPERGAQTTVPALDGSTDPESPSIYPDHLVRGLLEIETACAVLRRCEPGLELWQPELELRAEKRTYVSVWFLIGAIWTTATLIVAAATGATVYLLG